MRTTVGERRLDLHGAGVVVRSEEPELLTHLHRFLRHCGFSEGRETWHPPVIVVEVMQGVAEPPTDGFEVARHRGLTVRRSGSELVMSDGGSCARLDTVEATVRVHVAPGLERATLDSDRNLIVLYAVMSALRYRGLFGLHAACAAWGDAGCLLVAGSGSGKSTLVLGLLRAGWSLVADDSVILRRQPRVEALGLRRDIYLKEDRPAKPDEDGYWDDVAGHRRLRRRLRARAAYPDRVAAGCTPVLLVFPIIVDDRHSVLEPCDRGLAVRELIVNSYLTELEPGMAGEHLRLLGELSGQCTRVVLRAGRDLKERPELAGDLLEGVMGGLGQGGARS